MARGSRYNIVKDKIHVGMKSFGWKCKELYPSHNLWERNAKHQDTLSENVFQ